MGDMVELIVTIQEGWAEGSEQTVTGQGVTVQFTVPPGHFVGDKIVVLHAPAISKAPTRVSEAAQHVDGRTRRGSTQSTAAAPAVLTSSMVAEESPPLHPPPRTARVDTAALTGLRGMAAMQVALGHMTAGSNMRLDLLGGAAMPFFYLLSGFIMTLGYGQTQYANSTCCGGKMGTDQPQQMKKGRFWRNRFARLFPVYIATNAPMLPFILAGGGVGISGAAMGPVGSAINGFLTLVGANSWFLPIADVGMPANGVCWTITTMSFFYWSFPWLLPRFQRMEPCARNTWIIWSYWIQLVSYFGMFAIYSSMPVLQFRSYADSGESMIVLEKSPSMGYWVARAWPGTRIFVFAMGCLAALNRLEVHNAQTQVQHEATKTKTEAQVRPHVDIVEQEENSQPTLVHVLPVHGEGAAEGAVVIAEACSCWRVLCCCCSCMSIAHGPSSSDSVDVWARRTDLLTFLYVGSIFAIIMVRSAATVCFWHTFCESAVSSCCLFSQNHFKTVC